MTEGQQQQRSQQQHVGQVAGEHHGAGLDAEIAHQGELGDGERSEANRDRSRRQRDRWQGARECRRKRRFGRPLALALERGHQMDRVVDRNPEVPHIEATITTSRSPETTDVVAVVVTLEVKQRQQVQTWVCTLY